MRIIELRSDRVDFPRMLAEIREWLDRNDRPLVRFETEPEEGNGLTIKVQFEANDLADELLGRKSAATTNSKAPFCGSRARWGWWSGKSGWIRKSRYAFIQMS